MCRRQSTPRKGFRLEQQQQQEAESSTTRTLYCSYRFVLLSLTRIFEVRFSSVASLSHCTTYLSEAYLRPKEIVLL